VFAAEKLVSGSSTGSEKKQFVLNFMKNQGKTFDLEIIDAMIESTVEKLNLAQNKDKPKSTSVVVDKEKSA